MFWYTPGHAQGLHRHGPDDRGAQGAGVTRAPKLHKVLAATAKDPARAAEELRLLRRAAKRMALAEMPPDELAHMRLMEARSKGNFTRKIGELVMRTGISPLEYLVREMRDVSRDLDYRRKCAVDALPYVHAKIPQETKISTTPGSTVNFVNVQQTQLEALSPEEFDALCRITEKLEPRDMGMVQGDDA